MALEVLALAFVAACLALAGTDLLSWRRTASLRPRRRALDRRARWTATDPQGRPPLEAWPSGTSTSSPATLLAALAGVFAVAWGLAAVATHHPGGVAAVPW